MMLESKIGRNAHAAGWLVVYLTTKPSSGHGRMNSDESLHDQTLTGPELDMEFAIYINIPYITLR